MEITHYFMTTFNVHGLIASPAGSTLKSNLVERVYWRVCRKVREFKCDVIIINLICGNDMF